MNRYFSTQISHGRDPEAIRIALRGCIATVRTKDYPSYLATTLAPRRARASMFAVSAFNIETAGIKDHASDTAVAAIRLAWWKDTIEECFEGSSPSHPVAIVLREVIERHQLSKRWFNRILAAREEDLHRKQPDTIADVERYAEGTQGSIFGLRLESCGIKSLEADHVASHLGKALGVATLLKATPHHLKHGQLYIPHKLVQKHGINLGELMNGKEEMVAKLAEATFDVACSAKDHLEHARELKNVPPEAIYAFLPAVHTSHFLDILQRYDFNVLDEGLHNPPAFEPWLLHWRMLFATLRKKF